MKVSEKAIIETMKRIREPMRLKDMVRALDLSTPSRGKVYYHLKKLVDKGVVERYRDSTYGLVEVTPLDTEILKTLRKEYHSLDELPKNRRLRRYDGDDIVRATKRLIAIGYLEEWAGRLPDKAPTEKRYRLSPAGAYHIGVCAVCGEPLADGPHILATIERSALYTSLGEEERTAGEVQQDVRVPSYVTDVAAVHPLCRVRVLWLADQSLSEDSVCSYCGLPLSPRLVEPKCVSHEDISFAFTGEEMREIDNLVLEVESELEKSDWQSLELSSVFHQLALLSFDLSDLRQAELFVTKLAERAKSQMTKEEIAQRATEIWRIAREVWEGQRHLISEAYRTLCGPWGIAYSFYEGDWAIGYSPSHPLPFFLPGHFGPEGVAIEAKETFAFRHNGRWYHPFCARHLGIDDESRMQGIKHTAEEKGGKR